MKQKLVLPIMLGLLLCAGTQSMSQVVMNKLPLTADSLSSGNYKDVLKSFFQLALNKFTGKEKEVQFSSNPFAIMAKMDSNLLNSNNYVKYKHLRNLNFSVAAKLDSAYRFNGFSSGIKYALINQRDETVSRAFVSMAYKASDEYNNINNKLDQSISLLGADTTISIDRLNELMTQKNALFDGSLSLKKADTALQRLVREAASEVGANNFQALLKNDPDLNIRKVEMRTYDSLRTLFQNRLLWTVGISDTTYTDQFAFSNLVFSTDLVKGIAYPDRLVGTEINVKSALNLRDDTLKTGRDLKRSILSLESGLNFIFKTKQKYSWGELKISANYLHTFAGLYTNEKRDSLNINATLRLRIIDDIWIPIEIKYDPRSGNIFGFLNIRANFSAMKKSGKK